MKIICRIVYLCHRMADAAYRRLSFWYHQTYLKGYLYSRHVQFADDIRLLGGVKIQIGENAIVRIGRTFVCRGFGQSIDSGSYSQIYVGNNAKLSIGNHTGMSGTSIHCYDEIRIGDYVNVGAGTKIFDTDFHSLLWKNREDWDVDFQNKKTAPVHIGNYAFIGTRCIIGKGVHIGEHSVVAAGSVVVKDIPADEIWGGNPAKRIGNLKILES